MEETQKLSIALKLLIERNQNQLENYGKWAEFAETNQLVELSRLIKEAAIHIGRANGELTAGIALLQ